MFTQIIMKRKIKEFIVVSSGIRPRVKRTTRQLDTLPAGKAFRSLQILNLIFKSTIHHMKSQLAHDATATKTPSCQLTRRFSSRENSNQQSRETVVLNTAKDLRNTAKDPRNVAKGPQRSSETPQRMLLALF